MIPEVSNRFRKILIDSDSFQSIQIAYNFKFRNDSENFQSIPKDSECFESIQNDSDRFRMIPIISNFSFESSNLTKEPELN